MSSASSSENEDKCKQQAHQTYGRKATRRKRKRPTMTLEQFEKYSDYAEKKKKYDPKTSQKSEVSSSSTTDLDCPCWEVASRRLKNYQTKLDDLFKEVAHLRAENKRLTAELMSFRKAAEES